MSTALIPSVREPVCGAKPVCNWIEGSRRFTVYLDQDAAARWSARCWTALKAMPRHGADVGGFILGCIESGDQATDIWIQGFQPADSVQFTQPDRVSGTIGMYRSRKTNQPPSDADANLLSHYSDVADPLMLLVGPLPSSVSIFKQRDGKLRCVHTFSMSPVLAPPPASHESRVLKTRPEPQRAVEPDSAPKQTNFLLAAECAAVSFTLIIAAFLAYFWPQKAAVGAAPQNLNLSVQGTGPDYKISWDQHASVLQHAARGVLFIRDGDRRDFSDLSSAQLKTGSVKYTAATPEPNFRLDVYLSEPKAVGTVQVVKIQPPSPPIATATAPPQMPTKLPSAPARKFIYPPTPPVQWPPLHANPDANRPAPAAAPDAEPIVATKTVEPSAPPSEPPKLEQPLASARLQEPYVEVLPETVSGSRWEHIIGSVPVLRRFKNQEITPAVAISEVNPLVNVDRRSITRSIFVDVKVGVSEAGKVVFAEVTKYGEPPSITIANATLAAVKRWIFKPALNANRPVAAEMVLHFHFVP